ncbi:MAG: hypothetical protein RSB23_05630 [Alistipes sp.]
MNYKSVLIGFFSLVVFCQPTLGDARSTDILAKLSSGIRARGMYGVSFEVRVGGNYSTSGHYVVSGDRYYMTLGDAEVYCDGKSRQEVDNHKKEVVIDDVDTSSHNILNNPTRAFEFLDDEFTSVLLWEKTGVAAVKMTPKAANSPIGAVTVTVDVTKSLPQQLAYDVDGDRIEIVIKSITSEKTPPKSFVKADYKTYEFIDFR